jgi:N-acetylneuraminic acid mutarotase/predicted GH43/DUF377 family glycosyl hydrolase
MKKIYLISLISVFSLNLFCQFDWTKYPDNPVMVPGPSGEWDEQSIEPGSVVYHDSIYHMWYNGSKHLDPNRIGYATSPDGINWTKDTNNPVLDLGQDGAWDDLHIYAGQVVVIDSIFHMWYTGQDYYIRDHCIGHATSPDGINWTKDTNNPALKKGDVGDWDDVSVYAASVIYDGGEYHMWYGGWNSTEGQVGHATSPDGFNWTKDPLNPVLTCETEEWDYPQVTATTVLYDGNTYHMWYHSGGWYSQIGYATSKDGSAWTKYANNPVLTMGSTGDWDGFSVSSAAVIDSCGVKYKIWYRGAPTSVDASIGYAESMVPAWKQMTSMDITRGGAVSCVIDSMIYIFGGVDKYTQTVDSADVYNTQTDEWSDLAPVPMDLSGPPVGDIDGKIYFTGGWQRTGSTWITLDSTFAYDPEADSWEMKKECPKKIGGYASCVLNDKLYLFGGLKDWPENDISGQKDALVYDPATDTWDSLPDMLYAHGDGSSACVHDGKIYVLGGLTWISGSESNIIAKAEMYDPVENAWTALADMPVPVAGHINLVYEDKIYVIGGDSTFSTAKSICTNIIQEYDPSTNLWRKMHGMPFNRSGMMGQKVDNFSYLIGGYPHDSRDFPSVLSEVWKFDLRELKPFTYATGVSLDKDTLDLFIDATGVLVATVYPADASDPSVSWYSDLSWPVIATVKDGIVTGLNEGGTYIYITTNDGHFKDSCFVRVITTRITNNEARGFKLYPNPASDLITLEFKSPGTHMIRLTNLNGQLMYNKRMEGNSHQIDLSSFLKGVYLITVTSRDYVRTEKIIKQ